MTSAPDPGPVLVMRGLAKRFGATVALDRVDLELAPGEVHALLGENGAGKSTLVKVLSGALRPDRGEMSLGGRPYRPSGPLDGRRSGISMIYQELTLAPHLTVEENVCLGREESVVGFLRRSGSRRRIGETLSFLGHPEIGLDDPVRRLNVGARQVVEICRALMDRARILVMDEPTSSLTREDTERLFRVIRKLRGEGVAIIYISHFLEEVQEVADAFTVLRDGRVAGSGTMTGMTQDILIQMMIGGTITDFIPRLDRRPAGPALELDALKGEDMAGPVSFAVRRGEIFGLAGLIGAGRTETLRTIFGLDRAESGTVAVGGRPAGTARPWSRIALGLGLLSEDRQGEGLALSRSLTDNITLSRLGPYRRRGFLSLRSRRKAADGWLEALRIKARDADQPAAGLSGGNQQKVALARLLHQDADVLLLDEPTRGIDVQSKAQIYEWMGRLASEGKALVFVSSYFPELLRVCDRIAAFHRGRIVDVRAAEGWSEEALMAAAMTGKAGA
jgi:ribose transport system ATP-binding protein